MDEHDKPGSEKKARRPYSKPQLTSFELFERRSLTCTAQPNNKRTDPSCGVFHSSVG